LKERNIDCVDEYAFLTIDEALAKYYKEYVLEKMNEKVEV